MQLFVRYSNYIIDRDDQIEIILAFEKKINFLTKMTEWWSNDWLSEEFNSWKPLSENLINTKTFGVEMQDTYSHSKQFRC